jgi:hypothetical protein
VAQARALPATAPNLLPAPGWVTVIVVPINSDPRPYPSFELRQVVAQYLADRAPVSVEPGRITVIGPDYLPVGVSATIAAKQLDQSGVVKSAALAALARFFLPLTGGPDGRGWPFGRDVWLSDLAALLESVDGVDYVRDLELLLDRIPAGDRIAVPSHRIVVAGDMFLSLKGAPIL